MGQIKSNSWVEWLNASVKIITQGNCRELRLPSEAKGHHTHTPQKKITQITQTKTTKWANKTYMEWDFIKCQNSAEFIAKSAGRKRRCVTARVSSPGYWR